MKKPDGMYSLDNNYIKTLQSGPPVFKLELEVPIFGIDGNPLNEVAFREPTAGDIYMIGNPVIRAEYVGNGFRTERDHVVYFDMMAQLSGLPLAALLRMSPNDFATCEYNLDYFFIPGLQMKKVRSLQKEPPSPPDGQQDSSGGSTPAIRSTS